MIVLSLESLTVFRDILLVISHRFVVNSVCSNVSVLADEIYLSDVVRVKDFT